MTTITTRSGKGSPLTNNEVDANFTNLNTDKVEASGDSMTGDLSFGDNNKAIFGAGSDLQIFHTGTDSRLVDSGTGTFYIAGTDIVFLDGTLAERYADFTFGGAAQLYYDNAAKLATTSTGIDVTGTVVADGGLIEGSTGLTIRNDAIGANEPKLVFDNDTFAGASHAQIQTSNGGLQLLIESPSTSTYQNRHQLLLNGGGSTDVTFKLSTDNGTSYKNQLQINNNDISFYESTGTTPKFFWDSSAESLGIGGAASDGTFQVKGTGINTGITNVLIDASFADASNATGLMIGHRTDETTAVIAPRTATGNLAFYNYNGAWSETMRLTNTGNVGIGTSSASNTLSVNGNMDITGTIALENSTGYGLRDNRNNLFLTTSADTAASNRTLTFGNATYGQTILNGGNVGIGTSSPTNVSGYTTLNVGAGSIGSIIKIDGANSGHYHRILNNNGQLYIQADQGNTTGSSAIVFGVDATERMRIDSNGQVNIGTTGYGTYSSGDRVLSLGSGTTIRGAASGAPYLTAVSNGYFDGTNWKYAQTHPASNYEQYNGNHTFSYAASGTAGNNITFNEAMRITDSGTLLVGKTSANSAVEGQEFTAAGFTNLTKNGDNVLNLNRLTSDGDILLFRKDNSTVGSIGTFNSVPYFAGPNANAGGFRIDSTGSNGVIIPTTNTGANRDAATDLGYSSGGTNIRFRDLYLSGSVIADGSILSTTGTAAAAAIRPNNDINCGIFFPAANTFAVTTDGSEAYRVDPFGNLLVGTTDTVPSNNGASGDAGVAISPDGVFRAARSGNVALDINRMDSDGAIADFRKNGTTVGSIGTGNGGNLYIGSGDTGINFNADVNAIYPINAGTGGSSDASVDLGLNVYRYKDLYLSGYTRYGTNIYVGRGSAITGALSANDFAISTEASGSKIVFRPEGTERMRLDSSGNLLFNGTTDLDTSHIAIHQDAAKNGITFRAPNTSAYMAMQFQNSSGSRIGYIQYSNTATTFSTSSDQRLKENIVDAPSASDDIDAIQVRSFDWKADGSHQKYGMVAQELQSVAPEAVSGDADSEDMMGVDYSKLVPMLVKEIQSLRARVAQLEGEN